MAKPIFPKSISLKHRIFLGTNQREHTGCWEWQHGGLPSGYGTTRWQGKQRTLHRLSWEEWRGQIPTGLFVLHKCDNRKCCNPMHLFLGTHADNMRDMGDKGRQWLSRKKASGVAVEPPIVCPTKRARGTVVGTSKITEDQAREILSDTRRQRDIASSHGISQCQVWRIKNRISWAHI